MNAFSVLVGVITLFLIGLIDVLWKCYDFALWVVVVLIHYDPLLFQV